jgi:uncharacterized protein
MTKILCIYHGHCDDGFAAAWVTHRAFGQDQVEFYPGVYQQEPPDTAGRHVLMLDFSYKRPVMEKIVASCRSLVVLDHHKTAQEDLAFLVKKPKGLSYHEQHLDCEKFAIFDMNRSGATLAWDYIFPGAERPEFIQYIEDRDLWRKKLPGGDEFTIALRSHPQDFKVWDGLVDGGVAYLIQQGYAIQRYYRCRVEEIKRTAYRAIINVDIGNGTPQDVVCFIANAPYFAASEVAGELCDLNCDFGACYFEVSAGVWQYSLRSRGEFDVSKVALAFGGGGHKGAAGFTFNAPVHRIYHG